MSCLSRKVFSQFLVVILTFHKKINILRLLALKHSERSAGDEQGHGGKKKLKKKRKKLASCIACFQRFSCFSHLAKRKQKRWLSMGRLKETQNTGYTGHVYPELNHDTSCQYRSNKNKRTLRNHSELKNFIFKISQ